MSLKPTMKKCPRCKQFYFWNPDVGQIDCPNCGILARQKKDSHLFMKNKVNKDNK